MAGPAPRLDEMGPRTSQPRSLSSGRGFLSPRVRGRTRQFRAQHEYMDDRIINDLRIAAELTKHLMYHRLHLLSAFAESELKFRRYCEGSSSASPPSTVTETSDLTIWLMLVLSAASYVVKSRSSSPGSSKPEAHNRGGMRRTIEFRPHKKQS